MTRHGPIAADPGQPSVALLRPRCQRNPEGLFASVFRIPVTRPKARTELVAAQADPPHPISGMTGYIRGHLRLCGT
jgi:hypothetical protein